MEEHGRVFRRVRQSAGPYSPGEATYESPILLAYVRAFVHTLLPTCLAVNFKLVVVAGGGVIRLLSEVASVYTNLASSPIVELTHTIVRSGRIDSLRYR